MTTECLVEQRNAETYRERMRQIHRQTDRHTDRQTERHRPGVITCDIIDRDLLSESRVELRASHSDLGTTTTRSIAGMY